jgi:glycosyltransferase involved in cell wall biosynthesis
MKNPSISVLMPVYNPGVHLKDAIESILYQTFQDFEFIIINDGSTDGSASLLEYYAGKYPKIRLFHQKNQGLPITRNRGINLSRGYYIANMDADDISLPKRLEAQYAFLEKNPKVAALGTQIATIDQTSSKTGKAWRPPSTPGLVAWRTLFRPSIAHPTVMIKRSILVKQKGYELACRVGEDFALWTRLVPYYRLQSLPESLYNRRIWEGNITSTKAVNDEAPLIRSLENLHALYVRPVAKERYFLFFRNFVYYGPKTAGHLASFSANDYKKAFLYIKNLKRNFVAKHPYAYEDKDKIIRDMNEKLLNISYGVSHINRLDGAILKLRYPLMLFQAKQKFAGKTN